MLPHARPNARTVALVRLLRSFGPLPRRRRIPRQLQPDRIRAEYYRAILPFVRVAQRAFSHVRGEIVRLLEDERREQHKDRMDRDRKQEAKHLIDGAARAAAAAFHPKELADVAEKFARRTSDFQKEQLNKQVVAAMSVPLSAIEAPVVAKIGEFAQTNVELIKTVPERYFDRIRSDVEEAFASGMEVDTLADLLVERDGMADNDAERIARDQIGKLNAEVNQARQEAMGVEAFVWRTMNDARVRDEHQHLDGEQFRWDDPPLDDEGTPITPGEPIQCRCFAEPVFDEIVEAVAEES